MPKGGIHIGTSGWYYEGWSGSFYPAGLGKSGWLAHYVRHFSTVEINATFYRLPLQNMVKGWRDKAPPGFLYAAKGSRRITHLRKLSDCREDLDRFLERVAGLGEHLGPILWQLPPNLHRDAARLGRFLEQLPASHRHAVEFRHGSWLTEEIFGLLRSRGVAQVSISSRRMPMDLTVTADFVYVRLHGLEGGYAHDYTEGELRPWADHIRGNAGSGRDVFVYFNNDGQARAPKNAGELMAQLGLAPPSPPT